MEDFLKMELKKAKLSNAEADELGAIIIEFINVIIRLVKWLKQRKS